MRALVISDLHSNSEALHAVLSHVRRKRYDEVFCLGDFVGYGAQPNQVLDAMRTLRPAKFYIRGNHDRVAAGIDQGDGFNYAARHAALWTRDRLSGPNRDFLLKLPVGPLVHGDVMLCHGSPEDEDEYVFNEHHARLVFARHHSPIIFYGHTHLPVVFGIDRDGQVSGVSVRTDAIVKLDPKLRYLINPGSVGQPRDRNPLAACVLYDAKKSTVQFIRVAYDIEKTQQTILRAGLPKVLADRLAVGS